MPAADVNKIKCAIYNIMVIANCECDIGANGGAIGNWFSTASEMVFLCVPNYFGAGASSSFPTKFVCYKCVCQLWKFIAYFASTLMQSSPMRAD